MNLQHILVATDLSPEGKRCWKPVVDLARLTGARITLLHVVEAFAAIPHGAPTAPPIEPPTGREVAEARERIEAERAELGEGVEARTDVVAGGGDTAELITEYAREHDADLIAVGTHGRTGFRHLMLGSVAEGVVRRSSVPVLVFPQPKR
ncbi:MAG TPA: universal stress protein [Longimicrobiales bacterium]|nr:universal stress protein [Longimicrobiales bacterium]